VRQTGAIALNTFKETIRDRVLAVIVLFALLMIVASLWLGSISLGEEGRVMKDFGLVAVTFFGLVVAAFIAAGLIHKEVEKRTVFVLFSKPVSRAAFIAGKFLGLAVTLAVVVAVTIFFSTLGSAILASVLGICVFIAGQLSTNVLELTRLGQNALTEALSWVVFVLIPNLTAVDVKPAVVGEQTADWGAIGLWCGYLVAYVVVVLALATAVFRRREF